MQLRYILPLFLFLVVTLIFPVYAEETEDIDLYELPSALGTSLGISTVSAGVFLSVLLILPFNLCLMFWKKGGTSLIIVNFIFLGFFTSIGWLPNWTVLLVALILAGLYASKIKDMI